MTYEGLPSDWYLKLTGAASRMIRGEAPLSERIPGTLRTAVEIGAATTSLTGRFRARFWKIISRDRSRWRACSTAGATLMTTFACSRAPVRNSSDEAFAFGVARGTCCAISSEPGSRHPKVHQADPEMILQACIFEIVTTQVEQVPVPGLGVHGPGISRSRNGTFRYADMLYADGRRRDHWGRSASVPDVSRTETKLWFYFLAASFIDLGIEAIHFGQVELMNGNDRDLAHYSQVLTLIRSYAAKHARRHMMLCDAHVPRGGFVRDGRLLMDFHSFPLRIMEVPDRPQEAILKVGFSDGLYGRSKGGLTFSGWECEHLPYLVEIDNWGVSRQPGKAKAGGIWVWGYDEITWFAHQSKEYRSQVAALRLGLGAADRPQRPSADARQPHDAIAAGPQAMVLRQHTRARPFPRDWAMKRRFVRSGRPMSGGNR